MAGSTTKTVQGFVLRIGFPTNGQAKELPIATWKRLWKDVPENLTGSLPTQGRVTPNWVTTDTSMPSPGPLGPFNRALAINSHNHKVFST